jgi:predicted DNA-binding antitoxin AbrB/MazE fold protein
MNINDVARIVTLKEGKKVSVSIAQVKEMLKIVNELTDGELYKLLRRV